MAKQGSTRKSKKTTKTSKTETSTKSKGLGDTIEKITTATGIKAVVKAVVGEDCGCDERKEKLNKMFPYKREPECLNEEEIAYLSTGVLKKRTLTYDDRVQIATIHARVFNHKFDVPCTCSPKIWMQWVKQLQLLLDEGA
jgi:BRCT domain type II-containing protein